VLYEMLTGHLPSGHFDPPSEKVSTLNPRIDQVVLRALSSEPERRQATASEVKASLRDAIEKPALTRQERNRRLALRAFVASLVAGMLAAGGVLLWTTRTDKTKGERKSRPGLASATTFPSSGRLVGFGEAGAAYLATAESAVAVVVAAARDEFGLVLRPNGSVRGWGGNRFGQTNVPAGLNGVIAMAAGQGTRSAHALALRADGTVVGWGDNTFRQAIPPLGLDDVVAIAAGELHSLALRRDGRVVAWGNQGASAASVPKNLPPAQAIAAGAGFNVVLPTNGAVVAWGDNDAGQCDVPKLTAPVVEIAAGARHVVARLRDGRVVAWGDNGAGQCKVPAALPPAARVFAGGEGSAAVDPTGKLYAWGKTPGDADRFTGRVGAVAIGTATWVVLELPPVAQGP